METEMLYNQPAMHLEQYVRALQGNFRIWFQARDDTVNLLLTDIQNFL